MTSNHQRRCRRALMHIIADMVPPPVVDRLAKISVDARIAIAACDDELKHARAIGASWFEAYTSSYRVLDEIRDIAEAPMPALVLTRFRPMVVS